MNLKLKNDSSLTHMKLPLSMTRIRDLSPDNTMLLCNIALATKQALSSIKSLENKRKEENLRNASSEKFKIDETNFINNSPIQKKNIQNKANDIKKKEKTKVMTEKQNTFMASILSPTNKFTSKTPRPPKSEKSLNSNLNRMNNRIISFKSTDRINHGKDLVSKPISSDDVNMTKILNTKLEHKIEDLKFGTDNKSKDVVNKKRLSKAQEFRLIDRLQNSNTVSRILSKLIN